MIKVKRQKEDKSMYRRKEAGKQFEMRKNPAINRSFFNAAAPKLHKLRLSPNIVHFETWQVRCRLRRGYALIQILNRSVPILN